MKIRSRWVVKAGSNLIFEGGPLLIRAWMKQVCQLRKDYGIEVIWVTSGAIAMASDRTHFQRQKRSLPEKQALSAIGQPLVMDLYNLALQVQGQLGAQVLLTYDDLAHGVRRKNLKNTLEQLLHWKITPILNENDAVATEEIRFGDNDSLSAKVARQIQADRLIILTDVDGLYDRNPKTATRAQPAKRIDRLRRVTPSLLQKVAKETQGKAGSKVGTGGMLSKLTAAQIAQKSKIQTHLVKGDLSQVLIRIANGENPGTVIGEAKLK